MQGPSRRSVSEICLPVLLQVHEKRRVSCIQDIPVSSCSVLAVLNVSRNYVRTVRFRGEKRQFTLQARTFFFSVAEEKPKLRRK